MVWVKICGTTNLEDAQASIAAGADALGFIFATSKRRIEVSRAAEIIRALPPAVEKIGVFVNETPEQVAAVAAEAGLTGVQLHGDEEAAALALFRRALPNARIIKTLQVSDLRSTEGKLDEILSASSWLDAVLLDAGSAAERGGTGRPFDWAAAQPIVAALRAKLPVIVAGGLTPDNVAEAIRQFAPFGVDVVSGVEREPGHKDPSKVARFLASAKGEFTTETQRHGEEGKRGER